VTASRMNCFHRRFWVVMLAGLCVPIDVLLPAPTSADEPALAQLVSADVGLCVEVNDLKSRLNQLPSAEWFRRARQLSLVRQWEQGPEFTKLQAGKEVLEALLNQPLERFAAEMFGESVLLAVTPSRDGKPVAVLLSRAEREDSWDRALRRWDQLETHDVQSLSAFGRGYERRRKVLDGRKVGVDVFSAKLGRTLAISDSEEQIQEVLGRAADAADTNRSATLARSLLYRRASESLPANCLLRAFVNPRIWDVEIRRTHASDKWLVALWQKLEWLTFGVEIRDGIIAHAVVHHETGDLPRVWQEFVEAANADNDLAARLPSQTLLAGELRLNPRLLNWLRTLDPSEKAQRDWQTFAKVSHGLLGRDLFDEFLPHLRPGLGLAVVPRPTLDTQAAPVAGLLSLPLSFPETNADREGRPELRESLDGALLTLLNITSLSHNSRNPETTAVLRVSQNEAGTLRWLDKLGPYRPAYGISTEHLLLASDPRLITSFWNSSTTPPLKTEPLFAAIRERPLKDHQHWLFLHCQAARQFLADRHEPLRRQMVDWRKLDEASADRHLERLRELLSPFDAAFAGAKIAPGEVRLTVGGVALKSSP
jgi:hypothetical protein